MLVGLVCFVVYRFVMIGGLFGSALDLCSWWLLSWLVDLTAGGLCYFCFCLVFSVWVCCVVWVVSTCCLVGCLV